MKLNNFFMKNRGKLALCMVLGLVISVALLTTLIVFCSSPLHKGKYSCKYERSDLWGSYPVHDTFEFEKHTVKRTYSYDTSSKKESDIDVGFYYINNETISIFFTETKMAYKRLSQFSFISSDQKIYSNSFAIFKLVCIVIGLVVAVSITIYFFVQANYLAWKDRSDLVKKISKAELDDDKEKVSE